MNLRTITNKKGNISDVAVIITILFGFAIAILVILYAWNQMKTPLDESLQGAGDEATFNVSSFYEQTTGGITIFDTLVPILLVGLMISTLVSAFMIKSHPVIFFISLFTLAIFVIIAVIFGNTFQAVSETPSFTTTAGSLDVTTMIMKNLPKITLVIFGIIILVLFMKPRKQYLSGGI